MGRRMRTRDSNVAIYFLDLWNIPLALQQLRNIAQLLFRTLKRGCLPHVRQYQAIHEIVKPFYQEPL